MFLHKVSKTRYNPLVTWIFHKTFTPLTDMSLRTCANDMVGHNYKPKQQYTTLLNRMLKLFTSPGRTLFLINTRNLGLFCL